LKTNHLATLIRTQTPKRRRNDKFWRHFFPLIPKPDLVIAICRRYVRWLRKWAEAGSPQNTVMTICPAIIKVYKGAKERFEI
jgi:protein tyrosine phosphatase